MVEIYKTVRRTWAERLFTWPWAPLQATKDVRDYEAEFAHVRHAGRRRAGTVSVDTAQTKGTVNHMTPLRRRSDAHEETAPRRVVWPSDDIGAGKKL